MAKLADYIQKTVKALEKAQKGKAGGEASALHLAAVAKFAKELKETQD